MSPDTKNWIQSSKYDIRTAQTMFNGRRYVYVVFMCHLSVEKALKAIIAASAFPPKTHDLLALVKLAKLSVTDEYLPIIANLNETSVRTRYPEDMVQLLKKYNRKAALEYLSATKRLLKWLYAHNA